MRGMAHDPPFSDAFLKSIVEYKLMLMPFERRAQHGMPAKAELPTILPALQAKGWTAVDDRLLRLIRRTWDPSALTAATLSSEVEWTAMIEKALCHGVAELLCRSLRDLPAAETPEDLLDATGTFLETAEARGSV